MDIVNLIDINILSLVVLAFIVYDDKRRMDNPEHIQSKLFLGLSYILALLLVLDSLGRMFDGYRGAAYCWVNWASNVALYIMVPVAPACWAVYALHKAGVWSMRKPVAALIFVLAINTAISILSLFTGWYFTIDSANIYHRGPLFGLHMAICFLLLVYPLAKLFYRRNSMDTRHYTALMFFPVPSVIGGLLQSIFYGTSFIGCGMTVSILFIYLSIQAERLGTDHLTGVFNRRQLDEYVNGKISNKAQGKAFSAILIDIDNFKSINDSFGHTAGDRALRTAAALLKSCLRRGDFIARYGGDEFLIVLDIDSPGVLEDTIRRLSDCFYQFNQNRSMPYSLGFSTGYAVYSPQSGMGPEEFIAQVDKLMYQDKKRGGEGNALRQAGA